jgi:hypothetical protein
MENQPASGSLSRALPLHLSMSILGRLSHHHAAAPRMWCSTRRAKEESQPPQACRDTQRHTHRKRASLFLVNTVPSQLSSGPRPSIHSQPSSAPFTYARGTRSKRWVGY